MDSNQSQDNIAFTGLDVVGLKKIINQNLVPGPPEPGLYKPACVFLLVYNLAEPYILAIQKTDSEGYPWLMVDIRKGCVNASVMIWNAWAIPSRSFLVSASSAMDHLSGCCILM